MHNKLPRSIMVMLSFLGVMAIHFEWSVPFLKNTPVPPPEQSSNHIKTPQQQYANSNHHNMHQDTSHALGNNHLDVHTEDHHALHDGGAHNHLPEDIHVHIEGHDASHHHDHHHHHNPTEMDDNNNQFCSMPGMGMVMFMDGWRRSWFTKEPTPNCLNYFFSSWTLNNVWRFNLALIGSFLLSLFTEGLSTVRRLVLRNKYFRKDERGGARRRKLVLVGIYALQQLMGYIIMLSAMMYSIEILFAVVLGLAMGNFIFTNEKTTTSNDDNGEQCCNVQEPNNNDSTSRECQPHGGEPFREFSSLDDILQESHDDVIRQPLLGKNNARQRRSRPMENVI